MPLEEALEVHEALDESPEALDADELLEELELDEDDEGERERDAGSRPLLDLPEAWFAKLEVFT